MASFLPDAHASTPPELPPELPPKPGSHDASRISTPPSGAGGPGPESSDRRPAQAQAQQAPLPIPDPGDHWLPQMLEDKSTRDLAELLSSGPLLSALSHSPSTAHASLSVSHAGLRASLAENVDLAQHLQDAEARLARQRAAAQAQLLATHALGRQWQAKQSGMDHALAPFSPAALYQQLAHGVAEQGAVCHALEESFLEGGEGEGASSEREVGDWVRRYREARVLYYLRQERKERWDEGRVGGWR